jgi:hypothetical protein
MKTRIVAITVLLILGVLLFSCGTNKDTEQPQTVDVNAIRTQAVATYASSLTELPVTVPTSSPTLIVVSPTPTATDNVTTTPGTPIAADSCYNLIYIQDVTIPDGTNLKPNEVFTKTWLVQNNGGCAWPPGFTFNHFGGDVMRGQPVILEEAIPVGAKREISIQLVVPNGVNGLVQSSWRMTDANGNFFGDTLSVNIFVGDITTPAVTNTSAP